MPSLDFAKPRNLWMRSFCGWSSPEKIGAFHPTCPQVSARGRGLLLSLLRQLIHQASMHQPQQNVLHKIPGIASIGGKGWDKAEAETTFSVLLYNALAFSVK